MRRGPARIAVGVDAASAMLHATSRRGRSALRLGLCRRVDRGRRRQFASCRRRRRAARRVRRRAGNEYEPDRDQAGARPGRRLARRAGRARSGDTAIRGISNEPSADGLAELARGTASFGSIITKDRLSPLHLISAGHAPVDRIDILAAPGMVTNFHALAHSYDHVVVDAGVCRRAGDRAHRRDCAACGAGHRHAGECRHDVGAGSPPGVRI